MKEPRHRVQRSRVVGMGLLGALLVVAWGFGNPGSWYSPPAVVMYGSVVLGAAGLALLCWAWVQARDMRRPEILVAVWGAPLLTPPPIGSQDAWAYAAQGWLLAKGRNPYEVPQGFAGSIGLNVDHYWTATTAVYPPGSLWLQAGIARLFDGDPYGSVMGMRLLAVVAMVVLAVGVRTLARLAGADADRAVWFGVANPVVVLHVIAGGHNDGLQAALAVAALAVAWTLARRGQTPWALIAGGVLVGCAGLIKQPGVLAGMGVVALVHAERVRRGARNDIWALAGCFVIAAASALLVFVGVSAIGGLWFGWLNQTSGNPLQVSSDSLMSFIIQALRLTGINDGAVVTVGSAISTVALIAGLVVVWAWWGPLPGLVRRPLIFQAGAFAAFALLNASLQPWYLVSLIALLGLVGLNARGWAIAQLVCLAVVYVSVLQASGTVVAAPFVAVASAVLIALAAWRVDGVRRALGLAGVPSRLD